MNKEVILDMVQNSSDPSQNPIDLKKTENLRVRAGQLTNCAESRKIPLIYKDVFGTSERY